MGEGVAVASSDRTHEIEQIALGGGEVALGAAQRDTQHAPIGGRQGEGDLVLHPKRLVDLAVEGEPVELAARDEVRERIARPSPVFRKYSTIGFCPP